MLESIDQQSFIKFINVVENRALAFLRFENDGTLTFKNVSGLREIRQGAFTHVRDGSIRFVNSKRLTLVRGNFNNPRDMKIIFQDSDISQIGARIVKAPILRYTLEINKTK